MSVGSSSYTQSRIYLMPAAARISGVSSVCVSPGPSQPTGGLPQKPAITSRAFDHGLLVGLGMDRALLVSMTHELPIGVTRLFGDPGIVFADARVEGERRTDIETFKQIE